MASAGSLTHVAVVGGTAGEWAAIGDDTWWISWAERFAKVADHAGAGWVTLHPMSADAATPAAAAADRRGLVRVGGCVVSIDSRPDGRQRLADAVAGIDPGQLDEAAITAALNDPAPCDPDLMLIAAPANVLPASMVWELAYSELVYVDVPWRELDGDHLERAIDVFAARHRRFGGI